MKINMTFLKSKQNSTFSFSFNLFFVQHMLNLVKMLLSQTASTYFWVLFYYIYSVDFDFTSDCLWFENHKIIE